jgi:hypothetical protein
MARGKKTRKCQWCGIDDTLMEEMEFDWSNEKKPRQLFYHKGECWDNYLEKKAFNEQEQKEKDELNDFLKKLYGVDNIPTQAWVLLEKLRGGNPIFGKQQIGKRYKQGYKYSLIKETFDYCSETIEYYNRIKNFEGFMGAFRYALGIIIDKIYTVEQRAKEREKKEAMVKKHLESVEADEQTFESNYKKPSKNTDITDFLDD